MTTIEISDTVATWNGPALVLAQTGQGTLHRTLASRLDKGTVLIIDPDGSLTRHYETHPTLAPDGWDQALIYTWSPLDAMYYEPNKPLVAHALLGSIANQTKRQAINQLQNLLAAAAETDATLEDVIDWTLPTPALHTALAPWHIDNMPARTTRGDEPLDDLFTQLGDRVGTLYIVQNHLQGEALRAVHSILAAHAFEQVLHFTEEFADDHPDVYVHADHGTIGRLDHPHTFVPRLLDLVHEIDSATTARIDI